MSFTRCSSACLGSFARVLACMPVALSGLSSTLGADWNVSSGSWHVPAHWNPPQVPTASDNVYIRNAGTAQILSGYAYADDLWVRSGSRLEIHSGGTLYMDYVGSYQYIGDNGSVGTVAQYGGTNTCRNMRLGDDSGSTGYYTMSAGNLYVWNTVRIGNQGTGVFHQSGGTVYSEVSNFRLGYDSYSSGTYRLSGTGQLTIASGYMRVGTRYGYGRFEWFREGGITAGDNRIEIGDLGTLAMGYDFSSIPTVITGLENGTLEVTNNATVTKTADGVTSQVKYLRIGSSTGGGYGVQTGGTVQVGQTAYIGDGGLGVATQDGGTFATTIHLYLGINGGDGTYRLRGGALNVNSNIFGGTGTGTMVLDGGTLNHGGTFFNVTNLKLGDEIGRTGSYTLSAGKTMNVTDQYLGVYGTGQFTQSGGTANLTNLRFGAQASGTGTYLLTGGSLNVAGQVYDGPGAGTLQIDGGTFSPSGNVTVDQLKVGISATGSHTQNANVYNVGTLTLGSATYHLRGGSLNIGGLANAGGAGTLNIDGGMLNPSGSVNVDNLGVGVIQTGAHTQTGQTYTVGTLTLGQGTYTLAGGTLSAGSVANAAGTGTLALDGGTFSPSGGVDVDQLHVGVNAAASHTIAGGNWQVGSLSFGITGGGQGNLTLASGTLNVIGSIGTGPGSSTLILNGGGLELGGGLAVTDLKVGVDAAAAHTQSSKRYDIAGNLVVGSGSGSGIYRLEQSGQLQVGDKVLLGHSGGTARFEWYRDGGLAAGAGMEVGSDSTLAMGHNFDADALAGLGGLVTGLENATLEITGGATGTQSTGTVSIKTLLLGSAHGGGTYCLKDAGELSIATGGQLIVGSPTAAGRLDWHREGGLATPGLRLGALGTLSMGFDFDVGELFDGSLYAGSAPMGIETATLEITRGATARQEGGAAKAGTLAIGAGGQAGTYEIPSGNLHAARLHVGMGGPGQLDLAAAADVSVSNLLAFGPQAALSAEPGSRITLTGTDVLNYSMDAFGLADLLNLTLAFQPVGGMSILSRLEIAGEDRGLDMAGFMDNFALNTLIVGIDGGGVHTHLLLVDHFINQGLIPDPPAEALYVRNIYVHADATLDLNWLNVYYDGALVNDGMIINGMPQYIPEPATLVLLALGGLAMRRGRRRF